jgi:hypothetical protein
MNCFAVFNPSTNRVRELIVPDYPPVVEQFPGVTAERVPITPTAPLPPGYEYRPDDQLPAGWQRENT